MPKRKDACCFSVKLEKICNGIASEIEKVQRIEKEKTGRKVSKEKVVMRWLRELLELKKAS